MTKLTDADRTLVMFDPADFLDSEEAVAAYLEDAAESGDAAEIVRALGDVARARTMSQVARDAGLSRQGLIKALSGEGRPSFDTILAVASALGVRMTFRAA